MLYHFSEDGSISTFAPRPVAVPSKRAPGMAWLNGPLVWAIDAWHQRLYLFPRECPRIVLWPTASTTAADRAAWLPEVAGEIEAVAVVEAAWAATLSAAVLYRYGLPAATFESLGDAGMWVSRSPVTPFACEKVGDLKAALAATGTLLRIVPSLHAYCAAWSSTAHVSGIRLRNARAEGAAR